MNGVKYVDGFDYSGIKEPLSEGTKKRQQTLATVLNKYSFNQKLQTELEEEIFDFVETEIQNATLEFISRFFERLGKGSKIAYSVARALGFHVFLKDKDGNEIHSLNKIAEYWGCCPQLIDQLTKQIQQDLDIDPINNLKIQKKSYSYKVKSPDGYMTTGQAIEFLGISNKKLNGIISRLNIKKRDFSRGSKLISEDDLDRVELYLMEGVEPDEAQ